MDQALRPASLFTAKFMGDSNILSGKAISGNSEQTAIETALGFLTVRGCAETGSTAHLSVRPAHIRVGSSDQEDMNSQGEVIIQDIVLWIPYPSVCDHCGPA